MWKGIEAVRPGAHFSDIGYVIEQFIRPQGLSIVEEFCGHGVGRGFHEDPQVLHYSKRPGLGAVMQPGMIFTIEPMINAGRRELNILSNDWTAVTKDHSLSAQWEHSVLVTETGYEVLTTSEGCPAKPAWVK
jgi:methionyl aminopeptidase